MSEEPYEETGVALDQLNQRVTELSEQADALAESGGGGSGGGILNLENLAAALEPYLDIPGGDGGVEVDPDQLRAVVREELADIRENMEGHAEAFEFPARRVGPTEPAGDYHAASMWGVHFKAGRECYIRSARIDAREAGTFTAQVGRFDGSSFEVVDETTVSAEQGKQRVTLDLQVPDAGEYLLTRPEEFPLRRSAWNGWDDILVDNLRLIGGNNPGDYPSNSYYYYFADCEFVANQAHEFSR